MTRITIEVTDQEKKEMKILAAMNSVSMKDLILDSTIKRVRVNSETLKSFDDYKNDKNLTKHTDFNDLMKDLKS